MTHSKLSKSNYVSDKIDLLQKLVHILKHSSVIRIGYKFFINGSDENVLLNNLSTEHQKKILQATLKAAEECLEEVKEEFEKI